MIIDYLKVFLTWPVIGGLLIAVVLFLFKGELRSLISRIGKIKFPGGEVSTSQQEKIEESQPGPVTPPVLSPPPLEGMHLSPQQLQQVQSYITAEHAAARMWEYRYLNYFLAQDTQVVLNWLVGLNQTTSVSAFEAVWMQAIQNAEERGAILHALQMHVLITIVGDSISLTDKGREYASWPERRHLPPLQ